MQRPLEVGSEVDGKYRLLRRIDEGGMGVVYEAEDRSLGRRVALKVLSARAHGDQGARRRLVREARAAAAIQHPSIVQVYEVGSDGETDYVAMELLQGEDLAARIRRQGALPIPLVERLAIALADAMIAMHDAGIVHRDIKPRNLFLARQGREQDVLKVLDFGIARSDPMGDDTLTATGEVFGTPQYMAPEQLRGAKHADARSDIWAAGATLYQALTGQPPFAAESASELILKITLEDVRPVSALRPDVPARLAQAVERALMREPRARFQTARELCAALEGLEATPALQLPSPLPPRGDGHANDTRPAESHAPRGRARWKRAALVAVPILVMLAASSAWLASGSRKGPAQVEQAAAPAKPRAMPAAAERTLPARPLAPPPRDGGQPDAATATTVVKLGPARAARRVAPAAARVVTVAAPVARGTPPDAGIKPSLRHEQDRTYPPAGSLDPSEF